MNDQEKKEPTIVKHQLEIGINLTYILVMLIMFGAIVLLFT